VLDLHEALLVEPLDRLREVLLEDLAPERALRRELPPAGLEVPVQQREVHDPLVGRQLLVGGGDDLAEVLVGVVRGGRGGEDRIVPVGNDE
jgi:hypothetical protein